jgi:hypothetical protein
LQAHMLAQLQRHAASADLAQRASRNNFSLMSVELRSSALNRIRAPSGPNELSGNKRVSKCVRECALYASRQQLWLQSVASLLMSSFVRVELRSSILDMARAPTGPKPVFFAVIWLSAKQSASANARLHAALQQISLQIAASHSALSSVIVELRSIAPNRIRAPSGPN